MKARNWLPKNYYTEPPCLDCTLADTCKELKQTCVAFNSYSSSNTGKFKDEDIGTVPNLLSNRTIR